MTRMHCWLVAGAWGFMLGIAAQCQIIWAQGQAVTFSATGDVPYSQNQTLVFQQQLANHNRYSPSAFFVHVGDIFKGGEPCNESSYSLMANMLKDLAVPVYIVPGDNETIDCTNPVEGSNNWIQYFQNFEQNFCGTLYTERQSTRPENFAFTMSGVLFIGINMVGGSSPYEADANWVSQQFQAKVSQVRAAVIFSHVTPNHNTRFSTPFRQAAAAFGKPVLFLHGHGHSWSKNYPFPEQNILRVQVDNGASEDPVEVTVTTAVTANPDSIFVFKRNPWSSKTVYNMPPCVDAGPDQTIFISSSVLLQGQATDDGDPQPPGALTVTWSKASGPGLVTFENANALATTASFSAAGTYVLRLTANDGALQSNDELTITVNNLIAHEETQTGGSSGATTVTTSASLTGVAGHFYLAAISTRPKRNAISVSGLGLAWTLVKAQCAGRSTTGVEVWVGQGTPNTSNVVTATLASAATNAVIAVSRYSGVHAVDPIGKVISGNTNGLEGACSGGLDGSSYSFDLTTTTEDAVIYGAVAIRGVTHMPGAGYTERAEVKQASGNNAAALAVVDKNFISASTVAVEGSLSGNMDWAILAMEIKPAPPQYSLMVNSVGSGSVTLDPPGGVYDAGTVVTLTATPDAGFEFSGWSGDLSGPDNPGVVTMGNNKTVTAIFRFLNQILHQETQAGGSSNSTMVTTSASVTGVDGHLYLAAISTRPKRSVNVVSGLGLSWTLVKAQCSGRGTTGIEIWKAQGTPASNEIVTATLESAATNAVIAVSRYSGVQGVNPIGNVISGNTNGSNGACTGGVDGSSYSFDLATTKDSVLVYGAVAIRGVTHTPGTSYTERAEIKQALNNNPAALAVEDKNVISTSVLAVDGSFSGAMDWAMVALEIKPLSSLGKNVAHFEANVTPPSAYHLEQNYPNPFNRGTVIKFVLPAAGKVTLKVYDDTGQLVRMLLDGQRAAGWHAVRWHGRNQLGNPVAAGVYLYQLAVHGQNGEPLFTATQRMTLLK